MATKIFMTVVFYLQGKVIFRKISKILALNTTSNINESLQLNIKVFIRRRICSFRLSLSFKDVAGLSFVLVAQGIFKYFLKK